MKPILIVALLAFMVKGACSLSNDDSYSYSYSYSIDDDDGDDNFFAPTSAPVEACSGPFPGYPDCEKKISFVMKVRPDKWLEMRGLTRELCSIQGYYSTDKDGGPFCPALPTVDTDAPVSAPTDTDTDTDTGACSGPFPGYPDCESKVAFAMTVRPDSWFEKRELTRELCSIQDYFSEAKNGASCPAP